jgi:L-ornithine N5-monooxygenase
VATGYPPYVPELFQPALGDRVFHASGLLSRLAALPAEVDSFAVIGAGQTAGEVALYLHDRYPRARVHALTRNAGFRMYELGHFSNEAFFPEETDYFFRLDHDQRQRALAGVYATNYAAVDPDLSTALYRTVFEERLTGHERLHVHKRTGVTGCTPAPGGVRLDLVEVNTGAREAMTVSAVVLCTGFTEPRPPAVLEPFTPYLRTDAGGDLAIGPTYRVEVTDDCAVGIYLSGITEWRHGIGTATSFSQMALRAEAIRNDLQKWLTSYPSIPTQPWKESLHAHVQR